ncbi:hypothetical protein RSOLAG22IIIB_09973 [Rhizoctonia solani]|uniref:Lysine-specific metallo-endopeptidase domain-containing protein n=1 Tax=Rhizoctonia solani TaxID=456999 RepID=A0A0K6G0S6_9AGAM|nr:hypothetical protein RSOLAG22IIIB_09973 [Rhizoctonia solani]
MGFVTTALFFSFLVFQVSALTSGDSTSNAQGAAVDSSPNHIGTPIINYISCKPRQQAKINEAVMKANTIIGRAQFYLNKHKTRRIKTLYTTWFGRAEAKYYDVVSSRFDLMGVQASSFTYDCNVCGVQYPAPAYLAPASSPRTIRLCENFWGVFPTGTRADFKAGWIIRELSRAPEMGDTLTNWHTGLSEAKKLAKQPHHAVMSPNNYMYFAKNAPASR